ncbi:alpha-hydroxy acid oxidase [Acinetobacter sp. NIPH 2699]|uniref:alpha-hydroxy acid oxidase n=1 Tax=Acinetobacter sp. NIPH 2699 TaxID=2923433 RepID=UPI001F4B34C0|nr:alpha-hydroxy acid oxidase [Acinetobacter sp. NIPH 2699]MCH7335968.1 alpha-hydroxy-acid oxidizing protein [Acinetobacter sp. NIPH 2699]
MIYPRPALQRIPTHIAALADYQHLAREFMSEQTWAYLSGGTADELTLQENLLAYSRIKLQNRVLRDLSGGHTRLELFGQDFEYPIFLAPVAYQKLAHPDGELATVLAASAVKAGMLVSTQASISLEQLAQHAHAPLWFQLYIQHDRDFTEQLVKRAEQAGYKALVLTVDAPINGSRNREQRAGFQLPPEIQAVNLQGMPLPQSHHASVGQSAIFDSHLLTQAATWQDVIWLRKITKLPILLKGINTPQDALYALEHGVDGIIVSNHGGRMLDSQPATIDTLPKITQAIGGQIPVLLDGGIRRGTDIIKALALGANAVLIGRPYIYGLAVAGALGVAHVMHILRAELEAAMVLTGCKTLADINQEILWKP